MVFFLNFLYREHTHTFRSQRSLTIMLIWYIPYQIIYNIVEFLQVKRITLHSKCVFDLSTLFVFWTRLFWKSRYRRKNFREFWCFGLSFYKCINILQNVRRKLFLAIDINVLFILTRVCMYIIRVFYNIIIHVVCRDIKREFESSWRLLRSYAHIHTRTHVYNGVCCVWRKTKTKNSNDALSLYINKSSKLVSCAKKNDFERVKKYNHEEFTLITENHAMRRFCDSSL